MKTLLIFVTTLCLFCSCSSLESDGPEVEKTEHFTMFLYQFFNDKDFQFDHIEFPLSHEWKSQDDFIIRKDKIFKKDWEFLSGPNQFQCKTNCYITNIYDNFKRSFRPTYQRVLSFEGIGNGINEALYFQWKNNRWTLIKFSELSD